MFGYIDVGGGMRAVYGAGVLDRLIDDKIQPSFFVGVSAGSANIISYLGDHRGRTFRFYCDYSFRPEYMGLRNFMKTGSYINLDYIYSTLTNEGAEDPLNFDAVKAKNCEFLTVATKARTGEPRYFSIRDTQRNNHYELKASCSIPIVCKPFEYDGEIYFDGGISDPIPVQKALDAGCDKVVVVLTKPITYRKTHKISEKTYNKILKDYPESAELLYSMVEKYNDTLEYVQALEKEGKVLVIAPDSCCGVNTLSRRRKNLKSLYEKGYRDAEKIKDFLR